jgi:cyclase
MLNIRVIPCLLWKGDGLVKTVKFKNPVYVGDAINAIRIFNEKEVDELIILDIDASKKKGTPDIAFIKRIASECFMPLCYGGGIQNLKHIKEVVAAGVEKVSMNTIAVEDPTFIKQASRAFGSSTIVVCIDYKRNLFGKPFVTFTAGQNKSKYNPVDFACLMEEMGAGEIVLNSIEKDGTMSGYDLEILSAVTEKVTLPVIALGGAGKIDHFEDAITHSNVSAVAAGSLFVFQGIHKAVLINYPSQKNLERLNAIHHHN